MSLRSTFLKVTAGAAAACAVLYGAAVAYLWSSQDSFIYFPTPVVVQPTLPYVSTVSIPTSDGETLVAWQAQAAPGCPTILFLDGNAGRPEIQDGRWKRIHDSGLGFLGVYWRGYVGSTGTPSEVGFHIDAKAGLDYLKAQGLKSSNVIVHGFSIGSGPATRLASENDVAALVLEAPYFSMADLIATKAPFIPTDLLLRSTYRSDKWIEQVSEPLFIAHGTFDSVIPVSQGERLFEKAPEPKEFLSMAGSDHATLVRDGLYDHVWKFLSTYLPAQDITTCPGLTKGQLSSAELK